MILDEMSKAQNFGLNNNNNKTNHTVQKNEVSIKDFFI